MSVSSDIAEQYPFLAFLANDPQVGPLLRRAVDINSPFSDQKFTAELMKTRWWRRMSDSARQWQIIANTRPGEAAQQRQVMQGSVRDMAYQLGINPTSQELGNIREIALRMGLSGSDPYVQRLLVNLTKKGGRTTVGRRATTAEQLRATSKHDYFWPIPDHVTAKWANWITLGQKTMEDFRAQMQVEAGKRYPHMKDSIREGMTPEEIIAPYRQIIADEWGVQPAQVDIRNPDWSQLLGIKDPTFHKTRLPTESEVIKMARSHPGWYNTQKGRQMDASMADSILSIFGKRRSLATQ